MQAGGKGNAIYIENNNKMNEDKMENGKFIHKYILTYIKLIYISAYFNLFKLVNKFIANFIMHKI